MVGNDVVDLADPDAAAIGLHPRFDARVFGPTEQAMLAAAPDPHRGRWTLWAAKEAAYKLLRKREPSTVFAPSRFVVDRLHAIGRTKTSGGPQRRAGVVRHGDAVVSVLVDECGEVVQALAVSGGAAVTWEWRRLAADECPRAAVRALVVAGVGARLGMDPARLAVLRDGRRVPRIVDAGRAVPVDLSLSHHGRYVACAWSVTGSGA